ncbi:MAG: 1-deoxy-D-xylulose-5-phosphate reductoisomerase [Alphaproteobacteria bacterium]|uniref:1-deoxy-D-xylulose 5-phosphate reductoisomerase n=1 Tax=Candidatus Nitrobium versatile TaxID=2884831 RepID=A0A953J958_9BACT|nr:1-deoxy-D-xylulose-5-phosphate reductoisomerase [Candidatus Nitrobium versatile]
MKRIVILGSTGSIGKSALSVIARYPERFTVAGLTAGNNVSLLAEQIGLFRPRVVAVSSEKASEELKKLIKGGAAPEIRFGTEGICSVAALPDADIVLSSIMGAAGLLPTLAAIRRGRTVALANKETVVMAGEIALREAQRSGATLLPVDSEHSAVFQCMAGYRKESIRTIILTASGGPFLGKTATELEHVTPGSALKHPTWSMGRKITIDSATLMNKGLEVIEAHYLFGFPAEQIGVLVHPQSIVHSILEFVDGSCIAQLSRPDMRSPIAYALSWPERLENIVEPLPWERMAGLTFLKPDTGTFPCLSLAYDAVKAGGTMPPVLNAANEIAVEAFLDGIIGFTRIPVIIKQVMDSHAVLPAESIESILDADRWARERAFALVRHG